MVGKKNRKRNFNLVFLVILLIFLLSPISLSNLSHCKCCGCCVGCPGDCNTVGFPFAYYYWGHTNDRCPGIGSEPVSQISTFGLIADLFVWIAFTIIVYRISKRKRK